MRSEQTTAQPVTVIIPCYNAGRFIEQAIKSIVGQTYRHWQIIVVDDGSTDQDTRKTLESLNYEKMQVFFKSNGGVSSARNYGATRCDSEYLLFLDADDIFADTFLEKAIPVLTEKPEVGVVTCFERVFPDADFETTLGIWRPEGGPVENFLHHNNALASSLVRRQCWVDAGGYDEGLLSHEDWDFWIKITKHGWIVHTMPEILFHYRRSSQSKYEKFKSDKPEFIKRIVANNEDVYREHVIECLYEKEKACAETTRRIKEKIESSIQYKTGYYILLPLRLLRRAFHKVRTITLS